MDENGVTHYHIPKRKKPFNIRGKKVRWGGVSALLIIESNQYTLFHVYIWMNTRVRKTARYGLIGFVVLKYVLYMATDPFYYFMLLCYEMFFLII